jgi:hypothetical protein
MLFLNDYLASEVALEEPKIRSTDPNILIDNDCKDDELHFGMPAGSGDFEDEGNESNDRDAIPTASRGRRLATQLMIFDLGISHLDGYEGEVGENADTDADEEEESSQVDDGSTQNVED